MQRFHSFGEVQNSQNRQYQYSHMPQNSYSGNIGYEYSFQNIPSQPLYSYKKISDINTIQDSIIDHQRLQEIEREKSLSPIRQIQDIGYSPPIQQNHLSNMYPVTYQVIQQQQNQRYIDYSPNTRQHTLADSDIGVKNTNYPQNFHSQVNLMNDQQKQLYFLNESPFQSSIITPQKNSQKKSISRLSNNNNPKLLITNNQDVQNTQKLLSPTSQTNRALFSKGQEGDKQSYNFDQTIKKQTNLYEDSKEEDKRPMYDSIKRNVSQIVDKYFQPIQHHKNSILETQSMHQLSNHKTQYDSNIAQRINSQGVDKTWSPLFSNQKKNNNSDNSTYSKPFELGSTYSTYGNLKTQQSQLQATPSYIQYVTPDTERILQKWNRSNQGSMIYQNNQTSQYSTIPLSQTQKHQNINYLHQQNVYNQNQQILNDQFYNQHLEIKVQDQLGKGSYQSQNSAQRQQFYDDNQIQMNSQISQNNLQQQQNGQIQQQYSQIKGIPSISNIENNQIQNQDQSYSQLNNGFIQTQQQISQQNIQNYNTINNLSKIDLKTQIQIEEPEQMQGLNNAKFSSIEDLDSQEFKDLNQQIPENQNNGAIDHNNNIIYESNELFEMGNYKNKNKQGFNNNQSEVFQSLQNSSNNQILTPSCLNIPSTQLTSRKVSSESTDSQEFSLKQILNIPKTVKKTIKDKNQDNICKSNKNQTLLIVQIVGLILIITLLYILLIK